MSNNATSRLADLLAPIPLSEFFRTYFELTHLHVSRNDPDYFEHLLSISELDDLISSNILHTSDCRVFEKSSPPNRSTFTFPEESPLSNRVDGNALYNLFREGATLSITGVHRFLREINRLCFELSDSSSQWQCNLYITPPGRTGFDPHFDVHDVFVAQVYGEKEWKIYKSDTQLPLELQKQTVDPTNLDVTDEFELRQGDLLYIPRGIVHGAASLNTVSVHLTIGRHAYTWLRLISEAVVMAATEDVRLRRSVARFEDSGAMEGLTDDVCPLLASLEKYIEPAFEARLRLHPEVPQHCQNIIHDLIYSEQICAADELVRVLDMTLQDVAEGVRMVTAKSTLTFPASVRRAMHYIADHEKFEVRSIPELDGSGQLALSKCLVRDGVLRVSR